MTLRFSVITPSFNQAEYLPATLASVREQTYKPHEHTVYDPGSGDGSRDIAAAAVGVRLVAESDTGQADAVARGMLEASGDIVAWLNSDDEYHDDQVFADVAKVFEADPSIDLLIGDGVYVSGDGTPLRDAYVIDDLSELSWRLPKEVGILQPATFISGKLIERIGPVNRDLEFCMDYEFWLRAFQTGAQFERIRRPLARARYHADNKTLGQRDRSYKEVIREVKKHFGFAHYQWVRALADFQLNNHDGILTEAAAGVGLHPELEARAEVLNQLINGDFRTLERIEVLGQKKALGATRELLRLDERHHAGRYAKPISDDTATVPGAQCYTVGPQRWAFSRDWLAPELARSDALMERLKRERKSDTCVIVGNGPSLNDTNLDSLAGIDVFVTNYAFLNRKLAAMAKYVCVTNYLVAEQEPESFNMLEGVIKFAPYWLGHNILPTDETCYMRSIGYKEFGTDYTQNISWRSTVSFFAMQLAYALGYRKCILVGFDNSYVQPASVEGDLIDQDVDDPNHFDPRYFKGKTWQAADTDNMEEVYHLARDAFEKDGREIVNCTVGGRLEVFRRGELEAELLDGLHAGARRRASVPASDALPKVLLIDHTRLGNGTASGELKSALFRDWTGDNLLHLRYGGETKLTIGPKDGRSETFEAGEDTAAALVKMAADFAPDLILYRPVPDTAALHRMACTLIEQIEVPHAVWMFDDWPNSFDAKDPATLEEVRSALVGLLDTSTLALGISDAMAAAFEVRYGRPFKAIANGVDPADWAPVRSGQRGDRLVVRYAGSLAENMTLQTLVTVAKAVEALANDGVAIDFEIKTIQIWADLAAPHMEGLKHTSFYVAQLSEDDYRAWLSDADIVVIGYNFAESSQDYVRYSIANKLPECLASGAALFAVGPAGGATMSLLETLDAGVRLTSNDLGEVTEVLGQLARSEELRLDVARRGQLRAFTRFNLDNTCLRFADMLGQAAGWPPLAAQTGTEFSRAEAVRVDETEVVAHMLQDNIGEAYTMIDVGAHFGSSAQFFHELGWAIHCFEPDERNRGKLADWFEGAANVTIDARAVSDAPAEGAGFFTSTQSSGISGLRGFHASHEKTGAVDVTTMAQIIDECGLEHVDFLKIDVEGFDFSVLKGVPWDRLQPAIITCEYEDAKTEDMGHTWQDIAEYLRVRGYSIYVSEWHPIIRYGIEHDWRRVIRYPGEAVPADSWGNLLAFRDDPGLSAVRAAFDAVSVTRVAAIDPMADVKTEEARDADKGVPAAASTVTAPGSRLGEVKLFVQRVVQGVWRRRKLTGPALFGAGVLGVFALLAESVVVKLGVLGFAAVSMLGFAILYLAWRVYRIAQILSAANVQTRAELQALRASLKDAKGALARHDRALTDQDEQIGATVGGAGAFRALADWNYQHSAGGDLVAVMRAMQKVWRNEGVGTDDDSGPQLRYGHDLLMAILAQQVSEARGILKRRQLIEIGTSHTHASPHKATLKFAIFALLNELDFVTLNTGLTDVADLQRTLDLLGSDARIVSRPGEDYLATSTDSLDCVYINTVPAAGCSAAMRKAHDRNVQKVHRRYATKLIVRMDVGGIVVFENTWRDEHGEWAGGGRGALSLLLRNGFEIMVETERGVALRRVTAASRQRTPLAAGRL